MPTKLKWDLMLQNNNPRLDTQNLSAQARRLYETAPRPPFWHGESAWRQGLEGSVVDLGATHQRNPQRPNDYHALMQLKDSDFVSAAYLVLRERLPTTSEYYDALERLHHGDDFETLLLSLDEVARRQLDKREKTAPAVTLPGLKRGLLLARWTRGRKLGRLMRWALSLLRLDRLRDDQRRSKRLQDARYHALLQQMRRQAQGLEDMQQALNEVRADNVMYRQQLARLEELPQSPSSLQKLQDDTSSFGAARPHASQAHEGQERDFYRALENRFRGTPESIRELMKEHLCHVHGVTPLQQGKALLDLGSGRGEWLSLLRDEGITAQGVDLNAVNVRASCGQGLNVSYQDAIEALNAQADNSLGMITSFHLVEHLQTEDLRRLLAQALRALAPGGRLLLETPNPQNLIVSGCTFYLDPTHVRPIPPDFLAFLAEFSGFEDVCVMPLHPTGQEQHLTEESETAHRLNHFLYGPQDYALMASKPAPERQEPGA